jgi:hypothetical protein
VSKFSKWCRCVVRQQWRSCSDVKIKKKMQRYLGTMIPWCFSA